MEFDSSTKFITRRETLRTAAALTGGVLAGRFRPYRLVQAAALGLPQKPPPGDRVAAVRAEFGATPIQAQALTDQITLLSGPG